MTNILPFYVIHFVLTMILIGHSASFPDHLAVAYAKNKDISETEIHELFSKVGSVLQEDEAGSDFNLNAHHATR